EAEPLIGVGGFERLEGDLDFGDGEVVCRWHGCGREPAEMRGDRFPVHLIAKRGHGSGRDAIADDGFELCVGDGAMPGGTGEVGPGAAFRSGAMTERAMPAKESLAGILLRASQ